MSKKRLIALCLSAAMMSVSMLNASAQGVINLDPNVDEISGYSAKTPVNQEEYKTMYPDQFDNNLVSASWNEYAFNAHRLSNGDVEVLINVKNISIRGHYEHQATDSTGNYLTPDKNTAYYITTPGLYKVTLPADSVSINGYVYMNVSLAPSGNDLVSTKKYKIPVDAAQNAFDPSLYVNYTDKEIRISASSTYAIFTTDAKRLSNGDVQVDVNTLMSNAYDFYLRHISTSADSTLAFPNNNYDQLILPGPSNSEIFKSFIIPKNNVAGNGGYVYFEVLYGMPIGQYNAAKIKIMIK